MAKRNLAESLTLVKQYEKEIKTYTKDKNLGIEKQTRLFQAEANQRFILQR